MATSTGVDTVVTYGAGGAFLLALAKIFLQYQRIVTRDQAAQVAERTKDLHECREQLALANARIDQLAAELHAHLAHNHHKEES